MIAIGNSRFVALFFIKVYNMDSLTTWLAVSLLLVILWSIALYRAAISRNPNVAYIAFFLLLLGFAIISTLLSVLISIILLLI